MDKEERIKRVKEDLMVLGLQSILGEKPKKTTNNPEYHEDLPDLPDI